MNMIIHPVTKEIMTEDMFLSYPDWREIKFIKATDCQEIETATGFVLTGKVEGKPFRTELSFEDYFEGKSFKYENL